MLPYTEFTQHPRLFAALLRDPNLRTNLFITLLREEEGAEMVGRRLGDSNARRSSVSE